jgi:hypothetical protein
MNESLKQTNKPPVETNRGPTEEGISATPPWVLSSLRGILIKAKKPNWRYYS